VSIELRIMRLPHGADLPLPAYQSAHAAGLDLLAAVAADAPVEIAPGGRAMIPTGIAVALPLGTEGQIRPRSGLAMRHGVTVLNAPGTIDADYRGELQIILVNHGAETVVIGRAMRIAQLVVASIQHVIPVECRELSATERQDGGFGSTGMVTNTVSKHT
jgi:dUTP pyrophosphatase